MYIQRAIESTIRRLSKTLPMLLVCGPKGCGKTTTLQTLATKERRYVTLEDAPTRELAQSDPAFFLKRNKPPILIDEIQLAPELFPELLPLVSEPKKMGLFWLTSSDTRGMLQNIRDMFGDSLGILTMLGFSDAEIYDYASVPYTTSPERLKKRLETCPERDLREIFSRIFTGSFPQLYANPDEEPKKFYDQELEEILLQGLDYDIKEGEERDFLRFLTVLASNVAKPLVVEDMARSAAISVPTAQKWIDLLEDAYVIKVVDSYEHPALKRTLRQSILFFLDTGLCARLLKWNDPVSLEQGYNSAAFFETHVYQEILKSYLNTGREPRLFHYKDKDRREISLLLEEDNVLSPISIKRSPSPGTSALRNFRALDGLKGKGTTLGSASIISPAAELHPLDQDEWVVPSWLI